MTSSLSSFLETVVERGFLHQCTDLEGLAAAAEAGPIAGYIGFDCTAPSLHAGSLVSIMLLRAFQRAGHRPIVLMGGGTSKIGDPSMRDEARKLLGETEIAANMAGIRRVFSRFLRFGEEPGGAIMVDNADWLDGLNYIAFLRDYGRHFSVNRMLAFDSVKLRLEREQALSFLEFNYMILQAYDFLELARRHDCTLQMGGSDQWGNIVGGVELARRVDGRSVFGLTTPLLTTASGAKMGKTAAGAVWLNAEMLSPYDYWQFWRNTEDADVGRFLRLFTELPLDAIADLEAREGAAINDAKIVLADEATRLCHGEEARVQAAETARRTFSDGATGEGLPAATIARVELEAGLAALEAFRRAGLAATNSEVRRLVKAGGARINNIAFSDEGRKITLADLDDEGVVKLSAGKKRHALLRVAAG
ncbi:MAG: tyrosine--tRNA ligase [Rhodospirillales bacterium]|nr:tyrosine--tRNA ligase [Rhodospirillales bacterium]